MKYLFSSLIYNHLRSSSTEKIFEESMAPILFDELNVFTFPHSRMKKLMNCCTSKVGHTDYTSLNDFEELLRRLQRTFSEFLAHEEIENILVMKKLKKKLKETSPMEHSDVVCNCHKIDRFTPLMNLFRDGFAFIRRGNADRLTYGIKLHKAMLHFYQDFVPHMHEEENDIQPLLWKYFSEMELKMMRVEVIKMTLQKRENSAQDLLHQIERPLKIYVISYEESRSMEHFSDEILQNIMKYLTSEQLKQSCLIVNKQWNQCALKVLEDRSPICQIPNEILLRLFQYYLNPLDLFQSCIQVNRQWAKLIHHPTLWKIVNPINWARGQWDSNVPLEEQKTIDDDDDLTLKNNETRILNGFVKYFLPNYGTLIENLILYGSLTINDNLARKIFDSCPNLKHLNVGLTKLTSKAFLHFRWINSIESLNFEGCEHIDDSLFSNLVSSLITSSNTLNETIEEKHECLLEEIPSQSSDLHQRLNICQQCSPKTPHQHQFHLKILNLSGCYRITDSGLNLLISNGLNEYLSYVDLSGCIGVTSECVLSLVSSSKRLSNENLYLCDNLQVSLSNVNCCRNLENNSGRFCCRLIN